MNSELWLKRNMKRVYVVGNGFGAYVLGTVLGRHAPLLLLKAAFHFRVFHTHVYARKTLIFLHFTYFKNTLTNRH